MDKQHKEEEMKTGIVKRTSDELQPYRVWSKGKIIYFAKTRKEAELKLAEAKLRGDRT